MESDVHHMTSQILSILIDFIQDRVFFVPFVRSFYKSLTLITLELETILRMAILQTSKELSDRTIKIFVSFAL